MNIDLTAIFKAIIALLAAIITYKLVPWIKSRATETQLDNLKTAARIAVYAAEQIFPHGSNDEKLEYAVQRLEAAGFTLDFDELRAAAEQAVYELKNDQQMAEALKKKYEGEAGDDYDYPEDKEETNYHLPPLEDWPLEMIIAFVQDNDIPCEGCVTKEDYVEYFRSVAEPEHPPEEPEETE